MLKKVIISFCVTSVFFFFGAVLMQVSLFDAVKITSISLLVLLCPGYLWLIALRKKNNDFFDFQFLSFLYSFISLVLHIFIFTVVFNAGYNLNLVWFITFMIILEPILIILNNVATRQKNN